MATLAELFADPARLNPLGVRYKNPGTIPTRSLFGKGLASSLPSAGGFADTDPGQVGFSKSPTYTAAALQAARQAPLLGDGQGWGFGSSVENFLGPGQDMIGSSFFSGAPSENLTRTLDESKLARESALRSIMEVPLNPTEREDLKESLANRQFTPALANEVAKDLAVRNIERESVGRETNFGEDVLNWLPEAVSSYYNPILTFTGKVGSALENPDPAGKEEAALREAFSAAPQGEMDMGLLDQLGKSLVGAGTGYLTGGKSGAFAGALQGGLSNKRPLNFNSGLESALGGALAGRASGGKFPGLANVLIPSQEPGIGDALPDFSLGGILGKIPGSLGDILGGIGGGIGGAIGGIGGLLGRAGRGLFGGGQEQIPPGAPGSPEFVGPAQPRRTPRGILGGGLDAVRGIFGGGQGTTGQDLSTLLGLGLAGYGLSQPGGEVDLQSIFEGAEGQTTGSIGRQVAAEQARRQAAEEQFMSGRETGRGRLEELLGRGADEDLQRRLQPRFEQLNRQGLLRGPSGALDFALAQTAAQQRRETLPHLLEFERGTQGGLESLRGTGLEGEIGLGRTGLERELGFQDLRRSAGLRERLLESQAAAKKREVLLRAGGTAVGYGLGGLEGAGVGGRIGGGLGDILG